MAGNFTTYATSFMRNSSEPGLEYSESFWVTPTIGGCQGLSMYFGGLLGTRYGNRAPILLGALMMSGANFISSLTIRNSFGFFLFTYGVLQGTGVGFAYASPLKICCEVSVFGVIWMKQTFFLSYCFHMFGEISTSSTPLSLPLSFITKSKPCGPNLCLEAIN